MAETTETAKAPETASGKRDKKIIIAGSVIIVALAVTVGVLLARLSTENIEDGDVPLGYAMDARVMLDEDSLRAAAEEAQRNAREGRIALRYQNNAFSKDGKTFSCSIWNAPANLYDMFLTLYADPDMTDQLFLSGLIPPGSGFDKITLDRALKKGDHTVYVALTQVTENEDGEQMIKNQVVHTIEFHVQ